MPGPWEKYAAAQSQGSQDGPWAKYRAPEQPKEDGLLSQAGHAILGGVAKVGETIDRYGGAPVRAAIGAAQGGQSALEAYTNQFGEDPHQAPTGEQIAARAGASTEVPKASYGGKGGRLPGGASAAEVLGLGVDVAADPMNLIPLGSGAKAIAGRLAGSAEKIGQGAKVVGEAVSGGGRKVVTKVGNLMTGVPEKEIETYIREYPEVQKMISESGDDISGLADKLREGYQSSIRSKRQSLGAEVGKAIDELPTDKVVDVSPVVDELEKVKGRMNKTLRFEEVKQVDDLIDRLKKLSGDSIANKVSQGKELPIGVAKGEVSSLTGKGTEYLVHPDTGEVMAQFRDGKMITESGPSVSPEMAQASTVITPANIPGTGKITPKEMYEVKQFLQDRGAGAFMKDGQIFVPGKDAQVAAKNASREARKIVNTMSPTVAQANQQLSKLHVIEQKMNKNLLAPGKSDAALGTAGSGVNPKNAKELQMLGEMTGTNMLGDAEKFAAAKRFSNPGFSAADTTAKGVERMIKSSLVGGLLGGPMGAAIAAAATSPLALKVAIRAGRIPVAAIQKIAGGTGHLSDATINQAYRILKTEEGRKAFESALQTAKVGSIENSHAFRSVADEEKPKTKAKHFAEGGQVKTLGEIIGYPGSAPAPKPKEKKYAQGGGPIPGHAVVHGDSLKNDTVHAMLSPGEIVLPRSITQAKNAPELAAKFVSDHLKKSSASRGPEKWARTGASKLGLESAHADSLMSSPTGKQLLIEASDLTPSSKRFQKIKEQIKSMRAGK